MVAPKELTEITIEAQVSELLAGVKSVPNLSTVSLRRGGRDIRAFLIQKDDDLFEVHVEDVETPLPGVKYLNKRDVALPEAISFARAVAYLDHFERNLEENCNEALGQSSERSVTQLIEARQKMGAVHWYNYLKSQKVNLDLIGIILPQSDHGLRVTEQLVDRGHKADDQVNLGALLELSDRWFQRSKGAESVRIHAGEWEPDDGPSFVKINFRRASRAITTIAQNSANMWNRIKRDELLDRFLLVGRGIVRSQFGLSSEAFPNMPNAPKYFSVPMLLASAATTGASSFLLYESISTEQAIVGGAIAAFSGIATLLQFASRQTDIIHAGNAIRNYCVVTVAAVGLLVNHFFPVIGLSDADDAMLQRPQFLCALPGTSFKNLKLSDGRVARVDVDTMVVDTEQKMIDDHEKRTSISAKGLVDESPEYKVPEPELSTSVVVNMTVHLRQGRTRWDHTLVPEEPYLFSAKYDDSTLILRECSRGKPVSASMTAAVAP